MSPLTQRPVTFSRPSLVVNLNAGRAVRRDAAEDAVDRAIALEQRVVRADARTLALAVREEDEILRRGSPAAVRRMTASIRLKIAVLAPMPSASDRTAAAVKPGVFAISRSA